LKIVKPRPNQPWFNKELQFLKRRKCQAKRKLKKCEIHANFRNYRAKAYLSALISTRIAYNSKVLSLANKANSKMFYKHVQRLSGGIPPEILPSKYTSSELPNKFAEFFTKKVSDILSTFNTNSGLKLQV